MKSILSIVLFVGVIYVLGAQKIEKVHGWVDNDHYAVSIKTGIGEEKDYRINAKTGDRYETDIKKKAVANRRNNQKGDLGDKIVKEDNDVFVQKADGTKIRISEDEDEEQNATFSPDKKFIAYTKNNDMYISSVDKPKERRLTFSDDPLLYNGWASWVYYEEILGRGSRYKAFWWSPDGAKIAYLQFDDNPVSEFPIFRSEGVHGDLERTRYPKAGDDNPICKLGILNIETGETTWEDHDWSQDVYTAWPFWTEDGSKLIYQRLNRDQNHLQMYATDATTNQRKLIYEEKQHTWVDWVNQLHWLKDGKSFLMISDNSGWNNFYQIFVDGRAPKQITNVEWKIDRLIRLQEDEGGFYFLGAGPERITDRQIFFTKLDGSKIQQITSKRGYHRAEFSDDGKKIIDYYSNLNHPEFVDLIDVKKGKVSPIISEAFDANEDSGIKVEMHTITTKDGFDLPAYWVLPPNFNPEKKYPVVFSLYGGPGSEGVRDSYRDFNWNNLVKKGAIVISVDHRGSGKFGKIGKNYMHRNLGKWEMEDYITTVKWLYQYDFIDRDRIGIQGGSYGGYVAALALCMAGDYFTHGISSFPVTDWRLYDNVYTERYMDTPKSNPLGYEFGSVISHANKLKGKLLIVHGMMDDNVHMQNTMQLISKLQDEGKQFEMMVYPGERHGWGGPKRSHLMKLQQGFWEKHFFFSNNRP